jgi:hypothetical protein
MTSGSIVMVCIPIPDEPFITCSRDRLLHVSALCCMLPFLAFPDSTLQRTGCELFRGPIWGRGEVGENGFSKKTAALLSSCSSPDANNFFCQPKCGRMPRGYMLNPEQLLSFLYCGLLVANAAYANDASFSKIRTQVTSIIAMWFS